MVFTLALLLMSLSAAVAQTRTFKITHAVARNSKVNQMYVTTKSGDVKYYKKGHKKRLNPVTKIQSHKEVVPPGIEPGTQGFSVLCSTN